MEKNDVFTILLCIKTVTNLKVKICHLKLSSLKGCFNTSLLVVLEKMSFLVVFKKRQKHENE